jgi:hypothetical protein
LQQSATEWELLPNWIHTDNFLYPCPAPLLPCSPAPLLPCSSAPLRLYSLDSLGS